jgi:hypothetical protein
MEISTHVKSSDTRSWLHKKGGPWHPQRVNTRGWTATLEEVIIKTARDTGMRSLSLPPGFPFYDDSFEGYLIQRFPGYSLVTIHEIIRRARKEFSGTEGKKDWDGS